MCNFGSRVVLGRTYGIIEQAGGTIGVDSEEGRGTRFDVRLPRTEAPLISSSEAPVQMLAQRGRETLLLVEDDADVRALLAMSLADQGYTVVEAEDGMEAVERAQAHTGRIDLIVCDVTMPRLGGRDAVARIWERRPQIPVLFISGYQEDPSIREALSQETANFLAKPFSLQTLHGRVRDLLAAQTDYLSPGSR